MHISTSSPGRTRKFRIFFTYVIRLYRNPRPWDHSDLSPFYFGSYISTGKSCKPLSMPKWLCHEQMYFRMFASVTTSMSSSKLSKCYHNSGSYRYILFLSIFILEGLTARVIRTPYFHDFTPYSLSLNVLPRYTFHVSTSCYCRGLHGVMFSVVLPTYSPRWRNFSIYS